MFFILTLLSKIKDDKKVRQENYEIVKQINEFLELYANVKSERMIEEALREREELKEFVDAYLLELSTKEIVELIVKTNDKKQDKQQDKQQMQQKEHERKINNNNNIERSM